MNKIAEFISVMFVDYPDCVDIDQLQAMLSIKRTKAYELIKNGDIKGRKIGKEYKIPKINVIAYIIGEKQI